MFANPTAESTIRQGVTTEVVGNCGESFAPFTELARTHLTDRLALYGYDRASTPPPSNVALPYPSTPST